MSTDHDGDGQQSFTIKKENFDLDDSNSSWITESHPENSNEGHYGPGDGKFTVKEEEDSSENESDMSKGVRHTSSGAGFAAKLPELTSKDFDYIRARLSVVVKADSVKRHQLVQAMSSKLKYIEAITTGKNITKLMGFKSEEPGNSQLKVAKQELKSRDLFKPESESRKVYRQDPNSDQSDDRSEEAISSSESQQEDPDLSGSDQEIHTKVVKSNGANSETDRLVKDLGNGTVKCNVCDRILNHRKFCPACSSYASRMRWKCREGGLPLPSCRHKNFSGGAGCQSCRLRKYTMLSQRTPRIPKRRRWSAPRPEQKKRKQPVQKRSGPRKCNICEKKSVWFKGWRCSACFIFYARMVDRHQAGEELPQCNHNGIYAGVGCKGCRRIRLQREAALREPDRGFQLPELPAGSPPDGDDK